MIKYIQQASKGKLNYALLMEKIDETIHSDGQKNELNLFNFLLWAKAKRENNRMKDVW